MTTSTEQSPEAQARIQELLTLLRSRTPLLNVVSPDEGRVVASLFLLRKSITHDPVDIYWWRSTTGIQRITSLEQITSSTGLHQDTTDPIAALRAVAPQRSVYGNLPTPFGPGIYIFSDLHHHFSRDPATLRALRDARLRASGANVNLMVLSAMPIYLTEMLWEMPRYDYPLPTEREIVKRLQLGAEEMLNTTLKSGGTPSAPEDALLEEAARILSGFPLITVDDLVAETLVLNGGRYDEQFIPTLQARTALRARYPIAQDE